MCTGSVPWPYITAGIRPARRTWRAAPLPNVVRVSAVSLVSGMVMASSGWWSWLVVLAGGLGWWSVAGRSRSDLDAGRRTESHGRAGPEPGNRVDNGRH